MNDRLCYVAAALALLFALGFMAGQADAIPTCPEDAVLVGVGDFESGRWDRYTCGPARDDFNEEN